MKISNYLHVAKVCLLALSVFGFVACDGAGSKKDNDSDPTQGPVSGDPVTEQLSPEEVTLYFQKTGEQMINMFKTADQKAVIQCVDLFLYEFLEYDFDWSDVENHFEASTYNSIWKVAQYASSVSQGKRLPSDMVDFTFSFSNESAIFEADDAARTWKYKGKASDNSIQFIYTVQGKKCVAKLWGEGNVKTYNTNVNFNYTESDCYEVTRTDEWGYTYYDWVCDEHERLFDKTYEAQVPEKIIFTLTENSTEHARVTIAIDMQKNNHINADIAANVANINWSLSTKIASKSASFDMAMNYGSTSLFTVNASLPSYVTLPKNDTETWDEWVNKYGDQYESLIAQAGGVSCAVTLLNRAQVKTTLASPNNFYTQYRNWDRLYDYDSSIENYWEQPYRQLDANEDLADIYNSNIVCALYFNSDIQQALFCMIPECIHRTTSVWNENTYTYEDIEITYYDIAPALSFPENGQSYQFGEYFTESKYSDLIASAKNLANKYIELLTYWNPGPIE